MNNSAGLDGNFSIGQAALLASLLEASAPKVGNVHRGADFEDTTFYDFVVSAAAIQPVFDKSESLSVGSIVIESIQQTQKLVGTNTNLGIILLLAPLAKCSPDNFKADLEKVLAELTVQDRDHVYDAIRLAHPGGMGKVQEGDVDNSSNEQLAISLVDAMRMAEDRDTIARQYATGFKDVFDFVQPTTMESFELCRSLPEAIVHAHLNIMAQIPDTLIARKCGVEVAQQSASIAAQILKQNKYGTAGYYSAIEDFDFWLRSDSNRRNPGTSADLIAAGLFLNIRSGQLSPNVIHQSLRN